MLPLSCTLRTLCVESGKTLLWTLCRWLEYTCIILQETPIFFQSCMDYYSFVSIGYLPTCICKSSGSKDLRTTAAGELEFFLSYICLYFCKEWNLYQTPHPVGQACPKRRSCSCLRPWPIELATLYTYTCVKPSSVAILSTLNTDGRSWHGHVVG